MSFIAVSLWGAFMMAAIFYTQEARHPATKPLVAYMIFTTTFSLTALILFGGLFLLLQRLNLTESLEHPLAAAAFLAAVFLPAFLLGRRQIRKPRRTPLADRSGMGKLF
ncbi:MAG TPA: hypothetical protein VIR45_08625 [Kiloniellaceae bacterium]